MDPFQVRMDFLELLRRLNASQQSMRKVVSFALHYAFSSADDIWDCVMTECARVSLVLLTRRALIPKSTCCTC